MICIQASGMLQWLDHLPQLSKSHITTKPYGPSYTNNHNTRCSFDVTNSGATQSPPLIPGTPSLHLRLLTPLETWTEPLWHDIQPHEHIDTLWSQILSKTWTILVSNAAVHPNGQGTFVWTIWANSKLWSGEGYAPGPPSNMYLGIAKAYGVYTALQFLKHYCQHFPELHQKPHTMNAYCNNQGIIFYCSNWESICPYPRDAISDNYPIYIEISQMIARLKPLIVQLHHIKWHQDTKSDWPVTLPEKLNINCNTCASKMDPDIDCNKQLINPITQLAYSHLQIKEQIITWQIQHTLHDASQTPDYYDYLCNKFNWPHNPDQHIHWPTFQLMLTRFRLTERQFVTKFIHEWLPLQGQYHAKSIPIKQLCPSCQGAKETTQHFLACLHPEQQQVWKDLHHSIQKSSVWNNISSTIHNLFVHGSPGVQAELSHNQSPWDLTASPGSDAARLAPNVLWQIFPQMDWDLFSPSPNNKQYPLLCQNLTLMWQAALATWKLCNKHLHSTNVTETDWTQLQATIQQIFHDIAQDLHLQEALNYTSPEPIHDQANTTDTSMGHQLPPSHN